VSGLCRRDSQGRAHGAVARRIAEGRCGDRFLRFAGRCALRRYRSLPVVGAPATSRPSRRFRGRLRQGRVLAFGHPRSVPRRPRQGRYRHFMENALRGLGQGRTSVAVYRTPISPRPCATGKFDVTEIPSLDVLSPPSPCSPPTGQRARRRIERVRTFVTSAADSSPPASAGVGSK
jgi:hypothetical protein